MRGLSQARVFTKQLRGRVRPTTTTRWHGGPTVAADAPKVNVTFLQPDGVTETKVEAIVGETLLQTAHRNDIDLEGACEGGTSYLCFR